MKRFIVLALLLLLVLVPDATAFASQYNASGNNAVQDIMVNQRYEGAIDSIETVTLFVDGAFTAFITFVAFFIISVAMLRNVLAGCYCAFPKFWDRVAKAHEAVADQSWFSRITGIKESVKEVNAGTLVEAVLRIVPNIKVLTDFEDDVLDPKPYFMQAIPKMIGVIIIGVFIYNGYYRDTAAVVSDFGSEMFKRVMLSVDPVAIVDRITAQTGSPEFSTDADKSDQGVLINKVASAVYGKIISTYTDIKGSANKSMLAASIEAWIKENLNTHDTEGMSQDAARWAYNYKVTMTVGPTKQEQNLYASQDGLTKAIVFNSLSISSLNLDTTKQEGIDWNVNVTITFHKQSVNVNSKKALNDAVFNLGSTATRSSGKLYYVLAPASDMTNCKFSSNQFTCGDVKCQVATKDSNIVLVVNSDSFSGGKVDNWVYTDPKGRQHKIKSITTSSGANTFSSPTYSGKTWSIGEEIDVAKMAQEAKTKDK